MKKSASLLISVLLALSIFSACGNSAPASSTDVENTAPIADGVYIAEFNTDSSMFHVNEALDGKTVLTVENGVMSAHVVLPSKTIQHLYLGVVADAEKDEANWLNPVVDTVKYSDGTTDEANAFDVIVPYLDDEFDLALIGKKGVWYDHKVSVTNPVPYEQESNGIDLADGSYEIEVTLTGGSGKSTVESPAAIVVEGGQCIAKITWSSPHYDYMIVDGTKYLPVNTEGNSVFEIPVEALDKEISVIADTVAMSQPHEIEYTLCFDSATVK